MDHEIKELLEKNLALNEENNRLLRGIRRNTRIVFVWRVIYIGIFLGGAAVAFNFLKPYYEGARGTYNNVVNTQTEIQDRLSGVKAFFGGNASSSDNGQE